MKIVDENSCPITFVFVFIDGFFASIVKMQGFTKGFILNTKKAIYEHVFLGSHF